MKTILLNVFLTAIAVVFLFSPLSQNAFATVTCPTNTVQDSSTGICVPQNSTTTNAPKTLSDAIILVVNWATALAGLVAVAFIIYGGFRYVTSGGNEEAAEKGKTVLVHAIIGLVIIILAYAIVRIVVLATGGFITGQHP